MEEHWKVMLNEVEQKNQEHNENEEQHEGGEMTNHLKSSTEDITVEESLITKLRERRRKSKILYRNVSLHYSYEVGWVSRFTL